MHYENIAQTYKNQHMKETEGVNIFIFMEIQEWVHKINATLQRSNLPGAKIEIEQAGTYDEALQKIETASKDGVLFDLIFIDGFSVRNQSTDEQGDTKILKRAQELFPETPIYFLSKAPHRVANAESLKVEYIGILNNDGSLEKAAKNLFEKEPKKEET
jgi:hypothetical protein